MAMASSDEQAKMDVDDPPSFGKACLEALPIEIFENIFKTLRWEDVIRLSNSSRKLRRCQSIWESVNERTHNVSPNEAKMPLDWIRYRKPLASLEWVPNLDPELVDVAGRTIVGTAWFARFVTVQTSKLRRTNDDKIADVCCLILLSPLQKETAVLTLESTWPQDPASEPFGVFTSGTNQTESAASCHTLLQDERGCDNRDFFLGAEIEDVVKLSVAKDPSCSDAPEHTFRRTQRVQRGMRGTRRGRRTQLPPPPHSTHQQQTSAASLTSKKLFERGAEAVRITYKGPCSVGRSSGKSSQYLSFMTSEGARGGVKIKKERAERNHTMEDAKRAFISKNQCTTTSSSSVCEWTWIEIADPRRLLALPASKKNPRPAPHGSRHSARGMKHIPGLGCVLYANARKVADYLYDSIFLRHTSRYKLFVIPVLAKAPGVSEREQKKLKTKMEYCKKKGIDCEDKQTDILNQRGTTLLIDYGPSTGSTKGKITCVPVPCSIGVESRNNMGYGMLLKTVANGWHNWPEMWWRIMSEFIRSDQFQKADGALKALSKQNPADFYSVSACVITDIPCLQRAASAILKCSSDALNHLQTNNRRVYCPVGALDGYWMDSRRADGHFSLILGEEKDVKQFSLALHKIVQDIIPTVLAKHCLFDREGVTGISVCLKLKSLLALQSETESGEGGRMAKFLREITKKKLTIIVHDVDRKEERKAQNNEKSTSGGPSTSAKSVSVQRSANVQSTPAAKPGKKRIGKDNKDKSWRQSSLHCYVRCRSVEDMAYLLNALKLCFH